MGDLFASYSSREGAIKIWNSKSLNCVHTLDITELEGMCSNLCFDPSSTMLLAACDNMLFIWSVTDGSLLRKLEAFSSPSFVQSLTCSKDFLLAGSSEKLCKVWSTETFECLFTLVGHTGPVTNICITENQKLVVTGSSDCSVRIWSLEQGGTLLHTLQAAGQKAVSSLALSKDERFIFAGFYDGSIAMWNLNTHQLVFRFHHHEQAKQDKKSFISRPSWSYAVTYLCVDGQNLISCSLDGLLVFRRVGQVTCLEQFHVGADEVPCLAICPNRFVLASCFDKSLRLWKIKPRTHEKLFMALNDNQFVDVLIRTQDE
jgi:WD40 repeat protein